jgi:Helix-turn-helix domain
MGGRCALGDGNLQGQCLLVVAIPKDSPLPDEPVNSKQARPRSTAGRPLDQQQTQWHATLCREGTLPMDHTTHRLRLKQIVGMPTGNPRRINYRDINKILWQSDKLRKHGTGFNANTKLILEKILHIYRATGHAYPSISYLSKILSLSPRTIQAQIKVLAGAGLLIIHPRHAIYIAKNEMGMEQAIRITISNLYSLGKEALAFLCDDPPPQKLAPNKDHILNNALRRQAGACLAWLEKQKQILMREWEQDSRQFWLPIPDPLKALGDTGAI